jgi:hypothetical protein
VKLGCYGETAEIERDGRYVQVKDPRVSKNQYPCVIYQRNPSLSINPDSNTGRNGPGGVAATLSLAFAVSRRHLPCSRPMEV